MTAPPTGTVTFVFTDIEGSTRQATADPAAWSVARARHHEIVRTAFEAQDGFVFQTVGDAFIAAFSAVGDALAAAIAAQRGLQSEQWPIAPIRARMGLHTGAAEWRAGDYEGYLTLARAQRIMSVGHGGQVLLSQATADLAVTELPSDVALRDLGEHQLKDLDEPQHLYQLVAADLQVDFPALKSLGAKTNLPAQLTTFIGREHELAELEVLLGSNRLLTLTGPGGTGKTRLALQLASQVLGDFVAGAWLVELAPVSDSELVVQTVAATLGVRQQPGRTILDALSDYVRAKALLLILDNCEHLIESCARLADALLSIAPGLRILATSREAMGIGGETAFRVPSLPLPEPREAGDLNRLAENECVRLFVDRASSADPHFRLTEMNRGAVAEICRRLDGIPLAIELAAARIRVFPVEHIASRLDDRFRLLTGGSRTALERHQTLLALIDWSHDLLTEPERILLRRLSVFAGGWSLDAAQAVCDDALTVGALETLPHLADKSMVLVEATADSAQGRYRLLESIRQYAREKLLESGESEAIRDRHFGFFLNFAEDAEPKLRGPDQLAWLDRVELEHDNLRAALAWTLESRKTEGGLRLAGALSYFWELRGYLSEGLKWLEDALAGSAARGQTDQARRPKALYGAGRLRFATRGEPSASRAIVEESLERWRELGDKWWISVALEHVGFMLRLEGDAASARARLEEAVGLAREVDDPWPAALCLMRLAGSFLQDAPAARTMYEEAVSLARRVGDKSILSQGLVGLAGAYLLEGNFAAAGPVGVEALAEARAIGSGAQVFLALLSLAVISSMQGDAAGAAGYCAEMHALAREAGSLAAQLIGIFASGFVASVTGHPERGVRLLAAAKALADHQGINLAVGGGLSMLYQTAMDKAGGRLEPATFETAFQEGRSLTWDQALELATV
jgi:predicted ATPase/class 3 adenylate cyclase